MIYLRKILIAFVLLAALVLLNITTGSVQAQAPCSAADRNQGLVSGITMSGTFGNPTGQCVIDQKAAYVNFKVPNYDELKSIFYTQNKSATLSTITPTTTPGCPGGDSVILTRLVVTNSPTLKPVINVQCNITRIADTNPTNGPLFAAGTNQTVVIFADNNLYIDTDLNYGGDSYGLVIIAKGDIYIDPAVKKINAVLVNQGSVYTNSSSTSLVPNSQQLVINGSLINLSQTASRINFNRSLNNNYVPAEVVNYQPKYLVLLRGLLTQSYTIQREIGVDEIPSASLFPSPTGIPSPAPSQNPGSTFQNAFCVLNVYDLFNTLNIASDTDIPCS